MKNKINRAAQFMPFDALKGLQEELRRREELHSRIERIELDEDAQNEISEMLNRIEKNALLSVDFYFNGHYINIVGRLVEKNIIKKYLLIEEAKIDFADLYRIKIIEKEV